MNRGHHLKQMVKIHVIKIHKLNLKLQFFCIFASFVGLGDRADNTDKKNTPLVGNLFFDRPYNIPLNKLS